MKYILMVLICFVFLSKGYGDGMKLALFEGSDEIYIMLCNDSEKDVCVNKRLSCSNALYSEVDLLIEDDHGMLFPFCLKASISAAREEYFEFVKPGGMVGRRMFFKTLQQHFSLKKGRYKVSATYKNTSSFPNHSVFDERLESNSISITID